MLPFKRHNTSIHAVHFLTLITVFVSALPCASADGPQDYAARIVGNAPDGDTSVGTVIYAEYQDKSYLITAYHNVYKMMQLALAFDEKSAHRIPLTDFVEPTAVLDPIHDLAIFKCTQQGSSRLEGNWDGVTIGRRAVILKVGPQSYNGAHVIAVGNPKIKFLRQDITPLNIMVEATVSEYNEVGKRLLNLANNSLLSSVTLVFLENLEVTYGFSGGPVLFSSSQFKQNDAELVGMIEGGDPENSVHSWAIPVDTISGALANASKFSAFPPSNWPEKLLSENVLSLSDKPFVNVLQITPWDSSAEAPTVPLTINANDDLSITLRAGGSFKELAAVLHASKNFEILKAPTVVQVNKSGLFSFIWTVKPLKDSKDEHAAIEFSTESGRSSFSVPINIHLVDEPNKQLEESRAVTVLPIQLKEIQDISQHFAGKNELELRDDFAFEKMFDINVKVVLGSYRKKAFNENYDLAALLAPGSEFKVLQDRGGVYDVETQRFRPMKSPRMVRMLILPPAFVETRAAFAKFGDSTFLTQRTRTLIAEYLALVDENTIILGDALNDAEAQLSKRYPNASDKESDTWISYLWGSRSENLSPKAREIQEDLRSYVFTGANKHSPTR